MRGARVARGEFIHMSEQEIAPSAQAETDVPAENVTVNDRRPPYANAIGARPWLIVTFCVLFSMLVLDTLGVSLFPRRSASDARTPRDIVRQRPVAATPDDNAPPVEERATVDMDASPLTPAPEESPTPRATHSAAPAVTPKPTRAPLAKVAPSPLPSATALEEPVPLSTPAASDERPQEIEVRVPGGVARPQDTDVMGPPNNAHIVSADSQMSLGWNAAGATAWHVDVLAQGHPWMSADVTHPYLSLKVQPGSLYQWRVTAVGKGEVVPLRSFQFSNDMTVDFGGKEGAKGSGGLGFGDHGLNGSNGADGQDLEVWADRVDGFIRIRVEASLGGSQTVYLLPSSPPLRVSAAGGAGGRGGRGGTGESAMIATRGGVTFASGNGGIGGDGGNGGNGGTITLHVPRDLARYVAPDVRGGDAGAPGRGGHGATAAIGSVPDTTVGVPPGMDGVGGQPGQPGIPGQVVVKP